MVKIKGSSDHDELDRIMQEACDRHGLALHILGWARKTYDVFKEDRSTSLNLHLIRVESFATTSGEVRVYDDQALPLAEEIAQEMEKVFGLKEAVILREKTPE